MEKPPTKKSAGDVAREVGRAIVSAVPAAGGPLQVAFENIFSSPIEKRKQAWLEQLVEVVAEVQERVKELTPDKLAANEAFVTVAMQASQVAIRNHQQAKLEALRNAVLNSALPNPPQEDEQMIFLRLIDQLTPWHLRVLSVLNNPVEWMERNKVKNPGWSMGGVATVVEHCLPDLRGQRDTYEQIVRDLQVEGLVGQGQFSARNHDRKWNDPTANDRQRKSIHQIHNRTGLMVRMQSNNRFVSDAHESALRASFGAPQPER